MTPSSRLRPAIRNPALAASTRARAVAMESLVDCRRSSACCTSSWICRAACVSARRCLTRGHASTACFGSTRAAVEELPVQQQRDHPEIAAPTELVFLALDAAIDAEGNRRFEIGLCELNAVLGGARGAVQLVELGTVCERSGRGGSRGLRQRARLHLPPLPE